MSTTTAERRTFMSVPVYDLREGDVLVGTGGTVIDLDADGPWKRVITERREGQTPSQFSLSCADELNIYRRRDVAEAAPVIENRSTNVGTNTQALAGIRCPECGHETAFVVQITVNVVMHDDGVDYMGSMPDNDHFPGRVIDDEDGFFDDDPIQCYERRGGCGHRGTVKEFRTVDEAPIASPAL